MKTLAIIAEYNPFHLGHKYHIEESKRISNADHTIAIMSSSFVQRGEPSIIDKFSRAESAILNGIDLVIELPFLYSCQTAELFAKGGVQILNSLNTLDYISFGAEYNNIKYLKKISKTLIDEPEEFKILLKKYLSEGFSFPISRSKALETYFENKDNKLSREINIILNSSNNILAIEYLKELYKLKSNIEPIIINRVGNAYNDRELSNSFSSATSIREHLLNNDFQNIRNYLPESSYNIIIDFYNKYGKFNTLDNYYEFLNYKLITDGESIKDIFDIGEDLGNRFINNYFNFESMDDLIDYLTNKTHTRTRIKRAIVNYLLNNYSKNYIDIEKNFHYIRVLGSNSKGFEILNNIKNNSDTIILSNFSKYKDHPSIKKYIEIEKRATDLYYFGLNKVTKNNMDYITNPYLKK